MREAPEQRQQTYGSFQQRLVGNAISKVLKGKFRGRVRHYVLVSGLGLRFFFSGLVSGLVLGPAPETRSGLGFDLGFGLVDGDVENEKYSEGIGGLAQRNVRQEFFCGGGGDSDKQTDSTCADAEATSVKFG